MSALPPFQVSIDVGAFMAAANVAAMRAACGLGTVATLASDTDATMAANSDSRVPTQKAVVSYVSSLVAGVLKFKGSTDCSGNPNYPAATKGDAYVVSVAGKIGGAGGKIVEIGDAYVASADNAGGTEAGVGTSWFVLQANITGITTAGLAMMRAADAAAQKTLLALNLVENTALSTWAGSANLTTVGALGDIAINSIALGFGTTGAPALSWGGGSHGFWGNVGGGSSIGVRSNNATQWQFSGNTGFVMGSLCSLIFGNANPVTSSTTYDVSLRRVGPNVMILEDNLTPTNPMELRVLGTSAGSKYASLKHDGTNAIMGASSGRLTVAAGVDFQIGVAAATGLVAGALAALTTSSIVIYDATGTAYRVPCLTP